MKKNKEKLEVLEITLPEELLPKSKCGMFIGKEHFLISSGSFMYSLGDRAYRLLSLLLGHPHVQSVRISAPMILLVAPKTGLDADELSTELEECVSRNFESSATRIAVVADTEFNVNDRKDYQFRFI